MMISSKVSLFYSAKHVSFDLRQQIETCITHFLTPKHVSFDPRYSPASGRQCM